MLQKRGIKEPFWQGKRLAAEKPRGKSKSEIIGAQLVNIARQYGMHAKVDGGLACVATAAGGVVLSVQ